MAALQEVADAPASDKAGATAHENGLEGVNTGKVGMGIE